MKSPYSDIHRFGVHIMTVKRKFGVTNAVFPSRDFQSAQLSLKIYRVYLGTTVQAACNFPNDFFRVSFLTFHF